MVIEEDWQIELPVLFLGGVGRLRFVFPFGILIYDLAKNSVQLGLVLDHSDLLLKISS